MKAALKLVEAAPFQVNEELLWSDENLRGFHSVHSLVSGSDAPLSFSPGLASYFILRLAARGEAVLDPFCGLGTVPVEAAIQGRVGLGCDVNPLNLLFAKAKLEPADITEVTLWLQKVNLRKLINVKDFTDEFKPFYSLDTFREIINMSSACRETSDRASRFIQAVAAALLHGPAVSYLSAYSPSQISLHPEEQDRMNRQRRQYPDYRSLTPRVLRKAASVLRDGIPSGLRGAARAGSAVWNSDPRNMNTVPAASVDLIMSSLPQPFEDVRSWDNWLKNWFLGTDSSMGLSFSSQAFKSLDAWRDYMAESLFEMGRVLKPGKRAVLAVKEVSDNVSGQICNLEEELEDIVAHGFAKMWDFESVSVQPLKFAKLKNCVKERDSQKLQKRQRLLILRRR